VLETKKQVSETVSRVIQRSVAGWKTAEDIKTDPLTFSDNATFIFIYNVEKSSETTCLVTCVASFGLGMSKRDTGVTLGSKIKSFIEEFASISASNKKEDVSKQLEDIPKGSSSKQQRIDKIKSVTKNIWMKGSRVTSWIGASAMSGSPQRGNLMTPDEEKEIPLAEAQSTTTEADHAMLESVPSASNTNLSDQPISMTSLDLSSFDGGSPKPRGSVSEPPASLSPPPIPPRRSSFEMSIDKEVHININLSEEESNSPVELFWEFVTTADVPVIFSILFISSKDDKKEYTQYLEQGYSEKEKALYSSTMVHAYQYPSRGNVSVGCFPSGKFVFVWENSQPQKSAAIPITYQCKLRPFCVPKPVGGTKDNLSNYNSCLEGEISISRRSLVKIPIIYDWNMDADLNSDQPSIEGFELGMHTNLEWEFGTNGSDIQFGIFFSSAAEELSLEAESIKRDPESTSGSPSIASYLTRSYTEFKSPSSTLPKGKAFVPMSKCNSQKSLVSGSMAITSRFGVYTCVFDNTASTLLNRRVKYRIRTVTHIL
jgi:hypothetical protein